MIVANKFQTGFNQPKLVALYLDKKISDVDAVQTLSRLNRKYLGKDTTYVIDFANEPEEILKAFKKYDEGAELEDIQDLDVVYDKKNILDEMNIYNHQDLEKFKAVNAFSIFNGKNSDDDKQKELHKKLYAATQWPTDIFNSRLTELTVAISTWDASFDKAHKGGDEKSKDIAEAKRSELTKEREALMLFKTELGRFVRVYTYIAQLVELGNPELENFANFSKLLSKRLTGVSPERIDLSGLVLSGYSITKRKDETETDEADKLKGIGAGGSDPNDREKEFLSQIISRLNDIFGEIGDDVDQISLTKEMIARIDDDEVVSEQLKKNTKDQALEGDIKKFIKSQLINSRGVRDKLVRMLMSDSQNMDKYAELLFDAYKEKLPELTINK
jgi:type I restriction enzyme, R subunit